MKTGAVMVAAGMSSRMKAFKPMLELAGSTVIKTAISTLKSAGVTKVVVIAGNNSEQLIRHLSDLDVTCLVNEDYASTDMFYSACMGLRHIKDETDRLFFLPADVPLFSLQSLFTMMGFMDCSDCSILTPLHNGKRGHPLLIKNNIIPELLSYKGDKGLRGAVDSFSGKKEMIELPDIGMTIDADRPEDYELLQQYAKSMALSQPIQCSINVSLLRKERFFDNSVADLLYQISKVSSLSEACSNVGISYSSGWKVIKIAECQLGFPLLNSYTGGTYGGGSNLTEEGLKFLDTYRQFKQEIDQFSELSFHKYFADYHE